MISVIIATYNRCKILSSLLDSLVAQDIPKDINFEIIIVDNNSNDETEEVVRSYAERAQNKINIKYYFEPKQGKSNALNSGVRCAEGDILAFTDDDCILDANWAGEIFNTFTSHQIDFLAGKITPVFENTIPTWLDLEEFRGPLGNFNLGEKYLEGTENVSSCAGANISFTMRAYKEFGGFLVAYRGEEVELLKRWGELGARIAYSPFAMVYHRVHAGILKKSYMRKWFFLAGKNYSIIFKDNCKKGRQLFGISLWIYKRFIDRFFSCLLSTFFLRKDRFVQEVHFFHALGMFAGLFGRSTKFENLR